MSRGGGGAAGSGAKVVKQEQRKGLTDAWISSGNRVNANELKLCRSRRKMTWLTTKCWKILTSHRGKIRITEHIKERQSANTY